MKAIVLFFALIGFASAFGELMNSLGEKFERIIIHREKTTNSVGLRSGIYGGLLLPQ